MASDDDLPIGADEMGEISGKPLVRLFHLQDALLDFSRLFQYKADDRAMVIVGVAFLDTLLENILIEFLLDDEKEVAELLRYDQPLGTFGGRTRMVYCLGLIPKLVRADLGIAGKIRNRFAHDMYASFGDAQVVSWCKALQWHKVAFSVPPVDATARDLFHVGINLLVSHLDGVVSIARGEARRPANRDRAST